jgi:hypothetical protein
MKKPKSRLQRIAIDALGVLLIIAAILFGWLPGPGGIPLFLGGLGLLALNHEWARRWLRTIRRTGLRINETIFPDRWVAKLLYDVLTVAIIALAVLILMNTGRNLLQSLAIILIAAALGIFLFNRRRLDWLQNKFRS